MQAVQDWQLTRTVPPSREHRGQVDRNTINAKGIVASTGTVAERQGWTKPAQGMHKQDDLIGGRGPLCKPLLSRKQCQGRKGSKPYRMMQQKGCKQKRLHADRGHKVG